ncbi:MAG TPA: acylphosphatase [Alphaproteobacteria bacterium]|jgi:acylphosphatase|nr:acylphosphatase [Alphaproteobacteria bacterium]
MEGHMAARLRIYGRVQGVWFRGWTVDRAQALGLSGWVRNRNDGSVEVLVSGPSYAVEQMITACHDGPPTARVDLVKREPAAGLTAGGFTQKPTA